VVKEFGRIGGIIEYDFKLCGYLPIF